MNAGKSESWKWFLAAGVLLALLMGAVGCGGGGGTTTATVPTATIQGSVSGTIIMAIDETGFIADRDDTSGKTPLDNTLPSKYPFTLAVPVGHQYTIQFIVGEGTSEERLVPLYEGTVNIFSVSSEGKLDLGYVDTSGGTAAADNNILLQPGVTSGGTTGDNTISVANPAWGYKYFTYFDDSDGSVKSRFQVEIRDPSGESPVTDKSLVRGVAFLDNEWNALPLNGSYQLWNGTDVQYDSSGSIGPRPMAEVRGFLQAAPSSLAAGFYNVVVTDNAGNVHTAKVYFRQPVTVAKPTGLVQTINSDNSIKLSWTNPSFPTEGKYGVWLSVLCNDGNGDGIEDTLLLVQRIAPVSEYILPAEFVETLAGKSGIRWVVQIRQYDDTIEFPDKSIPGIGNQFYRNHSAESSLRLPGEPLKFTTAMLAGKIFYSEFSEPAGFVANLLFFNTDGSLRIDLTDDVGTETLTGSWSINDAGQAIANTQGGITTVTLLSDSSTEMTVLVDEEAFPPQEQVLQKTVPIDGAKLPGTYLDEIGDTNTFNADGTGNNSRLGNFTWSVSGGKLTIVWVAAGESSTDLYALANSQSSPTAYDVLQTGSRDIEAGTVVFVYSWTFTRRPLSAGITLTAGGQPVSGTVPVEIPQMSVQTFYALASGGTGTYTYNWSLSNTTIFMPQGSSTEPTYTVMVSGNVTWEATLTLTVTDSQNHKSEKTITLHTTGL